MGRSACGMYTPTVTIKSEGGPACLSLSGSSAQSIMFSWPAVPGTRVYKLIVENAAGAEVFSAILLSETHTYYAPSWLSAQAPGDLFRWRVLALDGKGGTVSETANRTLKLLR